jgi:hypothetical protein
MNVLAAMGVDESGDFWDRYVLLQGLDQIERDYSRFALREQPSRELVYQYLAALRKAEALAEKLPPDFLPNEIPKISLLRQNPHGDERIAQDLVDDNPKLGDFSSRLKSHEQDIAYWCKKTGENYRAKEVRKLIVEPVLELMAQHGVVTNRKGLPLSRIFKAVFDWLDIPEKLRLTNTAITKIARELRASS